MGLRIATNVQSISGNRHLSINTKNQQRTLEKLSSGHRIVRASDDAAGLAISEKMRAEIRSTRQNVRNANDAISMIQTAEGGMNEIANILVRFRELSIQAASDSLSDRERTFVDKEVQQLGQEVDRIAKSTEYNGLKLLDGDGDNLDFQVGLRNDPDLDRFTYDRSGTSSTVDALNLGSVNTLDKASAQDNLAVIDEALDSLNGNRAELGALQNRLESSVRYLQIFDENLSAGKSRIRDADFAVQTSELTKENILSQTSTAVLSQANQNASLALKLV
jgi:flagellin